MKLNMAQKLKMFREINNLSQEELGKILNVSDKTISAWENEERDISLQNANLIANYFNIPNEYFVYDVNESKLNYEIKTKIEKYLNDLEFNNKIKKIISVCKQKLENDGLPCKKEYIPVFNYESKDFDSYGIFERDSLPVQIKYHTGISDKDNRKSIDFTSQNLDDLNNYRYSSSALAQFGLFDILNKFNQDKVELRDLISCNNVNVFKDTLERMKSKKYTKKNIWNPFGSGEDISKEYIQDQLNEVLENLSPDISNFWSIIVFLIDNGAYYTKQIGSGDDIVCWHKEKDVSKTNLFYRIALDKITK